MISFLDINGPPIYVTTLNNMFILFCYSMCLNSLFDQSPVVVVVVGSLDCSTITTTCCALRLICTIENFPCPVLFSIPIYSRPKVNFKTRLN